MREIGRPRYVWETGVRHVSLSDLQLGLTVGYFDVVFQEQADQIYFRPPGTLDYFLIQVHSCDKLPMRDAANRLLGLLRIEAENVAPLVPDHNFYRKGVYIEFASSHLEVGL